LPRALEVIGATALIVVFVVVGVLVLTGGLTDSGGGVDRVVTLSITLGIPALLVVGYWLIARRQVREALASATTRLDGEQDVIARVSHSLRDRLTVVYGFSETLLDSDLTDTTEVRDILTVINAESVDLGRIVDDLVASTELDSDSFDLTTGKFDPAAEIDRVVVPFRRRGTEITVDCWSGTAMSDAIRFRQIVRSLLSNAVLHGGEEIAVIGELTPRWFRCTVADDGPGLSSEIEERIFREATSGDATLLHPGRPGLGLSVSLEIARRLGGEVSYQRSSEDLTMVTLVLPTDEWPDRMVETAPPPVVADEEQVDHADPDDDPPTDGVDHDGADGAEPRTPVMDSAPVVERRIAFTEDDDESDDEGVDAADDSEPAADAPVEAPAGSA
jgi:signal transduction histidine kinase